MHTQRPLNGPSYEGCQLQRARRRPARRGLGVRRHGRLPVEQRVNALPAFAGDRTEPARVKVCASRGRLKWRTRYKPLDSTC